MEKEMVTITLKKKKLFLQLFCSWFLHSFWTLKSLLARHWANALIVTLRHRQQLLQKFVLYSAGGEIAISKQFQSTFCCLSSVSLVAMVSKGSLSTQHYWKLFLWAYTVFIYPTGMSALQKAIHKGATILLFICINSFVCH